MTTPVAGEPVILCRGVTKRFYLYEHRTTSLQEMARRLAREEGLFGGISAAGACWVALRVAEQVRNATIVFVVCDRGDRYLSTGVFPA